MKSKRKILQILVPAVLIVFAVIQIFKYCAFMNADFAVRIAYRGLDNLFHAPYEYYTVIWGHSFQVPGYMAAHILGEDAENQSIYQDIDTVHWFVELEYAPDDDFNFKNGKPYLDTSLGSQYRLFYSRWAGKQVIPSPEDFAVMRYTAESLYNGDMEHWESKQGNTLGLISFMLSQNGDRFLVEFRGSLFEVSKSGKLVKVMDLPSGGQLDYIYFLRAG